VEFVFWIGLFKLAQVLKLLQARLVRDVVVSDDFDGHFQVVLVHIPRPDHVREHSLACGAVHGVLAVERLAYVDLVVAL